MLARRCLPCILLLLAARPAAAREWTDTTGQYKVEAELVDFDDRLVVLRKKQTGKLVAVPIEKLSGKDRDFLRSKPARQAVDESANQERSWKLRDGTQLVGRVIAYGQREVTFQRRFGKVYVNDMLFTDLPKQRQYFALSLLSHNENMKISDAKELEAWAEKQKGQPRTFRCEGVMMELEQGGDLPVPFCVFSDADLEVLSPGWKAWKEAEMDTQKRGQQELYVRSLAHAYQRDRQIDRSVQTLQALSDWVDMWEVALIPPRGGQPVRALVVGRNSADARAAAAAQYPGYGIGAIRRLEKR